MGIRNLLIALCLVGSLQAATLDRRDSLRVAALRLSGLTAAVNRNIDTTTLNTYVNMAIQQVSGDFAAVVKHRTMSVGEYVSVHNIDTLFDSLLFCIYKDSLEGTYKVLRRIPTDFDWDLMTKGQLLEDDSSETTSRPEFVLVTGDSLRIIPAPKFDAFVEISYSVIGRKLTADSMTTDIRPAYRNLVVYYAAYLICTDLRLFTLADRFLQYYEKKRRDNQLGRTD